MWSRVILCLFVGLAYATDNPAWKDNYEYLYRVHGRTLAMLSEDSQEYSGIIVNATLKIQPKGSGKIYYQIHDAKYAEIQSKLEGWRSPISEEGLSWKSLELSSKPFYVESKSGVIKDVVVSKDTSNWEANMYKSIVSQFQLNTKGKNPVDSEFNRIPEDGQNYGVYKTMEETVTGHTETLYRISPYPEYMAENDTRDYDLKDREEVIAVYKHKNYTNNRELPSYAYGFGEMQDANPGTNKLGSFFLREYDGHAILTGSLKRYTVQSSSTTEIVKVKPTLDNEKMSSVVSYLEVKLQYSGPQHDEIEEVTEPLNLGNLVYTYEMPNSRSNDVRRKRQMTQDKSPLDQPPLNPLLPLSVAYKGTSIKNGLNIVKLVIQYSRAISNYLSESSDFPSEDILLRFVKLTSLIRMMDSRELGQVNNQLYSPAENGPKHAAWSVYRDALAASGTGPALMTIQKLIMNDNLKGHEASDVVYTLTKSVRHPTIEYMRTLFELVKSPKVQSEWPLNDTALISFSELAWNVYVHKQRSRNQFPVKAFGSFYTEEGQKFVEDEVIPFLSQQLQDAISHANTHNIHAYIRTLGNIAHPKILQVLEPYLEGKKQVSQFQRFLMVVSMDKLARTYPEKARSVLFKIYQNPGEAQEVRVAAVYQLIKSDIPVDMAQSMAIHTLDDKHEYVNAAVKSYLESAANLQPQSYDKMQSTARSAAPFLTKKSYGIQNGAKYVRNYFYQSVDNFYRNSFDYITNEDELMPQKIQYTLDSNLGGVIQSRLLSVKGMISSFEELVKVAKQQTYSYEQEREKQQSQYRQHQENKFSSENIAKLLNIKSREREQLEGALFMKLGAPYRMFGFDNMTIQRLSEAVRDLEEELKNGKKFNTIRISNSEELALSFPTVMGLPFLYTYDQPTVWKVQGSIEATATPQVSQRNKLYKPDRLQVNSDLSLLVGSSVLGRLSFTTPFDQQQYISGFDKQYRFQIPFSSNVEINLKNLEVKAEIRPKVVGNDVPLLKYSSWPLTSRINVLNSDTMKDAANTRIIYSENVRTLDQVWGEEQTGMALRIKIKRDRNSWDPHRIITTLMQEGLLEAFMSLNSNQDMQHSQISIYYLPQKSSNNRILLRASYQEKYQDKANTEHSESEPWYSLRSNLPRERQSRYIETVSKHVDNAKLQSGDYSVEFQGGKPIKYTLTTGQATSMSAPKSHFILQMRKTSDNQEVKPYEVSFEMKNFVPHVHYLDEDQLLASDPKMHSEMELTYGQNKENLSKLKANVQFYRSQEREQYIKQQPLYEQCKREMSEGNKQLPACVNVTLESKRLDRVDIGLMHDNVVSSVDELLHSLQYTMPSDYYNAWTTKQESNSRAENEVLIQARFDEDLKSVNVSIQKEGVKHEVNNIGLNEWSSEILVQNPHFDLKTRLIGRALRIPNYRPLCAIGRTQASTFETRMYPVELSKQWTVMFQYVPKQARETHRSVFEQLLSQSENYVVLVRESEREDQKDLKITFSSPETDFEVLDVTMTPRNKKDSVKTKAQVEINDQEVEISERAYSLKKGFVEIFTLPSGKVMMVVRNRWYVIYDGHSVRLDLLDGQFASSIRGLCGQWNGMVSEDFATPEECFVHDHKQFIKSYELGAEGQQVRENLSGRNSGCIEKVKPMYVDVVSGRNVQDSQSGEESDECMNIQTRYIEEPSQICFTIRPMPTCNKGCRPGSSIHKNIPVHCISKSPIAQLWKSQIDRGTSPDFSQKKTTKAVYMQLPESCSQ